MVRISCKKVDSTVQGYSVSLRTVKIHEGFSDLSDVLVDMRESTMVIRPNYPSIARWFIIPAIPPIRVPSISLEPNN